MSDFHKKWLAVLLSLQALLLPIGFSGTSFIPLPQEAVAAAASVTPRRLGRAKRIRSHCARRQDSRVHKERRTPHKLPASAQAVRAIERALRITHEPHSWMRPLEWLAFRESTYNPHAIAYEGVGGQSACGLFQVMPTTFSAHELPGLNNIWNPVDNAVAAIRYIAGRYGTPQAIPGLDSSNYAGY